MRILILGGTGLIGHSLWYKLSSRFSDVYCTIRKKKEEVTKYNIFDNNKVIEGISIDNFAKIDGLLCAINPDFILNCIGITKRKPEIKNIYYTIQVNSIFPYQLADWCFKHNKKLIHFSTDCVFNGKEGGYTEDSITTAEDTYGRTKALGEVKHPNVLVIRSSFIGRELFTNTELLEWFLQNKDKKIKGYTKAFYSGVSTLFLSKVIGDIIELYPNLSGLYQLANPKILSKYELLQLARKVFKKNIDIEKDDTFECNNTLDGGRLRSFINYEVPSWEEMLEEIAKENLYNEVL